MTFEMIKRNYDRGLWTKQMIDIVYKKGLLTLEQYNEILGIGTPVEGGEAATESPLPSTPQTQS